MSMLNIPAAPAAAAPLTFLSAAAKPMAQKSDLVQVRFGGWHSDWGRWHGGRGFLSLPSLLPLGQLGREGSPVGSSRFSRQARMIRLGHWWPLS
jgi:hypothetical protein